MEPDKNFEMSQDRYYPCLLFKESIVILITFTLIVFGLSMFFPVGLEDPADPTDNLYVPKPQWYFMWFYQLLKYFPGKLEIIATAMIPAAMFLSLLLLPFIDSSPAKRPSRRPIAMALMLLAVLAMVLLTILGFTT